MGTGFSWGTDQKAVAMTDEQAQQLVEAVVAGVAKGHNSEFMEQYRLFVQTQIKLENVQAELGRRDAEIAHLREQINNLRTALATMASSSSAQAFHPYNNNGTIPSSPPSFPLNTTGALPAFVPELIHTNGALPTPATAG